VHSYLGQGIDCEVYLARDQVQDTDVALKVAVGDEMGQPPLAEKRLLRETAAYNRVRDHRHVLKVHDIHRIKLGAARLLAMSMEYAEGGTFDAWLQTRGRDPDVRRRDGLQLFRQACRGVQAIHDAGLIHRDLKPGNFVLTNEALKVGDLGAVVAIGGTAATTAFWNEPMVVAGTPAYMSPEHFTASNPADLSFASDIYSLGVILYEVLNPKCRVPFIGSFEQLYDMHANMRAPALLGIEPAQARVVARCMEKAPNDRYPSVEDLIADLEGCAGREGTGADDQKTPGEMISLARDLSLRKQFDKAVSLCQTVLRVDPTNQQAKYLVEEANATFDQAGQFYRTALAGMRASDLSELLLLCSEAVAAYRCHPEGGVVLVKLAHAARAFRRAMELGLEALNAGRLETATRFFRVAAQANPGPEVQQVASAVSELRDSLRDLQTNINAAIEEQDCDRSLKLAHSLGRLASISICPKPLGLEGGQQWKRSLP